MSQLLSFPTRGKVFVSACEPSADLYAARFIERLKKDRPALDFIGIGGPEMKAAGVELIDDYRGLMSFGLSAAAEKARSHWSSYRMIARALYNTRPDVFLPVAYPGMNLLLCRYARRLGIKTIYLLPPQIWAWGGFRKYFVRKWVEQVLTFFPFEYDYYISMQIPVRYYENPLIKTLKSINRTDSITSIGFMPGSRPREIHRNLPVIIKLADRIKAKNSESRFVIILRDKTDLLQNQLPSVTIVIDNRYQAMKNCDLLVTCSGTASLEAAFLDVPQVFFNRPSRIDYHLMRRFVSTAEFNLANLYYGKKIVPVHIGRDVDELTRLLEADISKMILDKNACIK
jgi:lipid-A-disaccharide synthase